MVKLIAISADDEGVLWMGIYSHKKYAHSRLVNLNVRLT